MNWSTGRPRPHSWKATKLTMQPSRGLGSSSLPGAIHSGLLGSVTGRRRPSSTSDYIVSSDMSDGPQGSARRTTAPPAMGVVENAATAVRLALFLSLSLPPPSPFFSLALSVLSNRSRVERTNAGRQGKKGREGSSRIYEGGKRAKRAGDETRKVSLRSSAVNPDPTKPPTRPPSSY